MKPPGKDARARRAMQAARERDTDPAEHPEGTDYGGFPKGAIDATNALA